MKETLVEFSVQLLEIVLDAHPTTSYKFALLLALIDHCQQGETGSVTTRQIAERVIDLYWFQTRPFGGLSRLVQLKRSQPSIVDYVAAAQEQTGAANAHAMSRLHKDAYADLVDRVELLLVRNPIPRLQQLGGHTFELIYVTPHWRKEGLPPGFTRYQAAARRSRSATEPTVDNRLLFLPGAERNLALLADLFRPLVRREWAQFVSRMKHGSEVARRRDTSISGRTRRSRRRSRTPRGASGWAVLLLRSTAQSCIDRRRPLLAVVTQPRGRNRKSRRGTLGVQFQQARSPRSDVASPAMDLATQRRGLACRSRRPCDLADGTGACVRRGPIDVSAGSRERAAMEVQIARRRQVRAGALRDHRRGIWLACGSLNRRQRRRECLRRPARAVFIERSARAASPCSPVTNCRSDTQSLQRRHRRGGGR